tara:strand:+ start:1327 stop:2565 length:1239 start_codon:yes stop_codon:yes gene_type:complete
MHDTKGNILKQTRIILYTGKGGVGKTSIAAATALRASQNGLKTIVLSTDSAHSLGDSFDMELSPEPKKIAKSLWAQESDVYYNMDKYWGKVQLWLESLLAWEGFDPVLADEMVVLPGMDELASLLWILEHHKKQKYDLIVVDCAPTAETFRLLSFPEAGRWWLEKIFPLSRRISGFARPVLKKVTNIPMPDDDVFDATAELMVQIEKIQKLLSDPKITSLRLVTNPEKMVIKETQRAYTQIGLFGYLADLIVCNRVIPEDAVESGYFKSRIKDQQNYLKNLDQIFGNIPIKTIPMFDQEIFGLKKLDLLASALFDNSDPTQFFYTDLPFEVISLKNNDNDNLDGVEQELRLKIPSIDKSDLKLNQTGEELIIEVGRYRRNMLLPRSLQKREVLSASMNNDILKVKFGGQNNE